MPLSLHCLTFKRPNFFFFSSIHLFGLSQRFQSITCERFLSPNSDSEELVLTQYLENCLYLLTLQHQFQQTILLYSISLTLQDAGQILTVRQHDLNLQRFSIYSFLWPRNEFIITIDQCIYQCIISIKHLNLKSLDTKNTDQNFYNTGFCHTRFMHKIQSWFGPLPTFCILKKNITMDQSKWLLLVRSVAGKKIIQTLYET